MATPSHKSKRRWVQFSLRTGFIVVTAVCVALNVWVVPLERQRRAVVAIEALGGTVGYGNQQATSELFVITSLRRWFPAVYFDEVIGVYLGATRITDAELAQLQGLTSLQVLSLNNTQITGAGLAHLQGLTNLRHLDLDSTQVADAGLARLKGLIGLQELYLNNTNVADVGLAHLQGLTSLQGLGLSNTQVTDAGSVHLQEFTSLKRLNLYKTQVTDAGIAELQQALPSCQIYRP